MTKLSGQELSLLCGELMKSDHAPGDPCQFCFAVDAYAERARTLERQAALEAVYRVAEKYLHPLPSEPEKDDSLDRIARYSNSTVNHIIRELHLLDPRGRVPCANRRVS